MAQTFYRLVSRKQLDDLVCIAGAYAPKGWKEKRTIGNGVLKWNINGAMKIYMIWYQSPRDRPTKLQKYSTRETQRQGARLVCLCIHDATFTSKAKIPQKKKWEALKVAYEDTGANKVCIFLEKLFDIKLKRCSSMEQYVTKILGAAQEVKDAGCKFVQLTTDYVKGQLLQQDYTPGGREGNISDRAFVTQNRGRNNQDVTQKKKKTETAASFVGGSGTMLLTATRIPIGENHGKPHQKI
ncbi:hypothetical protein PR048_011112 [Dryococelus australis]|uniref:Uncharacterized protein n=1 Tax=Dryococelus australis TaxID=614101 RepID=A0ABQ9HLD8_9NEOP|nr:hypothetical protein PR048_011112 [Dryococelus australis]